MAVGIIGVNVYQIVNAVQTSLPSVWWVFLLVALLGLAYFCFVGYLFVIGLTQPIRAVMRYFGVGGGHRTDDHHHWARRNSARLADEERAAGDQHTNGDNTAGKIN